MIVRALDVNGDWTFGKGKNDYLVDLSAVAQSVKTRLSSFLGDCFFSLSSGLDWFNLLGSKNVSLVNLSVGAVILNTPNVSGILELSVFLNESDRELTLQYKVQTTFGPISETFQFDLNGLI